MEATKKLVEKFNDKKTLPSIALRVNQLAQDENSTIHDLEEIIRLDPVLVTRLLKLVNSPFFGLAERVTSISKAVVYVGLKQLQDLVMVEALKKLFREGKHDQIFSRKDLWMHSATVAIIAQIIAPRIFGKSGDDFFITGIIHDIGLIVEDQVSGELFRKACKAYIADPQSSIIAHEQEFLNTNHCLVGAEIARGLQFPKEVIKGVKFHHDNDNEYPIHSTIGIMKISNYIANKMSRSFIKDKVEEVPSKITKHIKNNITSYQLIIKELPGEMEKAKELYEL